MAEPAQTYRITLSGLSRFRGAEPEHRSGHSKKGVFTSFLYGKLGREGAPGYIAQLKGELGEGGYEQLIEKIVEMIPPKESTPEEVQPQQEEFGFPDPRKKKKFQQHLDALGFIKDSDSSHPAAAIASSWKTTHRMSFTTFDELKERLGPDDPYVFSAKMDGELVCIWFQDGATVLVTGKGTIRSDTFVTNEVSEQLKKFKKVVLMGELYVVDENGKPQSYMRSASALKDPKAGMDDFLRLIVFDVVEVDGKSYEDHPMMDKMKFINDAFTGGKYVYPADTKKENIASMEQLWNDLDKKGIEGLVVHMPDDTILKTKPIMSYDMVIVAVTKGVSVPGRIGAILAAMIDKDGRYRLNGHIGTGLTDEQRIELMEWAKQNMIKEDEEYIWVDPTKSPVIEVEALEVNPKIQPALEFKDGKFVEVENAMSGILRFPTLKFTRPDKDPKYPDVRVDQLPFETSVQIQPGMHICTITGRKGKVQKLVPNSGDSGKDYDLIIEWDEPVWGITVSEVHPTEITGIVVEPEKHGEISSFFST
jgi:hypothetical protein